MLVGRGVGGMKEPVLDGAVTHGGLAFVGFDSGVGLCEAMTGGGLAFAALVACEVCAGLAFAPGLGRACCHASSTGAFESFVSCNSSCSAGFLPRLYVGILSYTFCWAHGLCRRTTHMKSRVTKVNMANLRGERKNMTSVLGVVVSC